LADLDVIAQELRALARKVRGLEQRIHGRVEELGITVALAYTFDARTAVGIA
jgi:hypothetical protein